MRFIITGASGSFVKRRDMVVGVLSATIGMLGIARFLLAFLGDLDGLIRRGARQFKFVDRTFNLSAATSALTLIRNR